MTPRPSPLAFILALALLHWRDGYTPYEGDYAQYLSHARALAEGRPYADVGYIYTAFAPSIGPRVYPPGLPLTLYPFLRAGAGSLVAPRILMLLFAAAFLAFVARWVMAVRDRTAAAVVLLLGVSPWLLRQATLIGSDVPFAALVWAVVWLADVPAPWSWRRVAAIGAVGAAAILFRTAGIVLVPAIALYTALHFRRLGWRPFVPAALWCATFVASTIAVPASSSYVREQSLGVASLARIALTNVGAYRLALFDGLLYPFPWRAANGAYHVVALLLMVVGLVALVRAAPRRFVWCLALPYAGLLLVWHAVDGRYFLPLLPLVALGLVEGVERLVRLARRASGSPLPSHLAFATAAALAAATVVTTALGPPSPSIDRVPGIEALFAWLAARPDAARSRVMFFNPRVITWRTGVPAMTLFDAPAPALLGELARQHITYVVTGDPRPGEESDGTLRAVIAAHGEAFTPEYRNETFTLYRFDPTRVVVP